MSLSTSPRYNGANSRQLPQVTTPGNMQLLFDMIECPTLAIPLCHSRLVLIMEKSSRRRYRLKGWQVHRQQACQGNSSCRQGCREVELDSSNQPFPPYFVLCPNATYVSVGHLSTNCVIHSLIGLGSLRVGGIFNSPDPEPTLKHSQELFHRNHPPFSNPQTEFMITRDMAFQNRPRKSSTPQQSIGDIQICNDVAPVYISSLKQTQLQAIQEMAIPRK